MGYLSNYMDRIFKIVEYLLVGVAGVIIILLLATLFPDKTGWQVKIVQSGSMEPAIPTGSLVVLREGGVYRAGDVITFGRDTRTTVPTTHRIMEVNRSPDGTTFITKGDNNEEADPRPVERAEVVGKVLFDIPYAGYVIDFARTPTGFIILVVIPAAGVIFNELATIWEEVSRHVRGRRSERRS